MFSKEKGTTASMVSILVFVGCCAAMVADFNLWWLPLCAVPLVVICNINYRGHWESAEVDREAEHIQSEEPYSRMWPFEELEATPSKEQLRALSEVRSEHSDAPHSADMQDSQPITSTPSRDRAQHIDEDV